MLKHLIILGVVILSVACSSTAQQPPTETKPQAGPTPVAVSVTVLNAEGENALDLKQPDFRLFESDQEQKIVGFSSVDAPFNIVLLLDTSSNVGFKIEDVRSAAAEFIERLRPQNRVMVISFNKEISLNSEFTTDRTQLQRAINDIGSGSGARLYDAVETALLKHLKPIEGRKALVLFTAGTDSGSQTATARSTLELAEETGALIYTIRYRPDSEAEENPSATPANTGSQNSNAAPTGAQYLRQLTDRTGARSYQTETTDHLKKALSMIPVELRQQYTLSYNPSNTARDGSYRRLVIKVMNPDRPGMTVYARPGYRATK